MDIYRQLRLFLDDTEHGLPLEPLNLEAYFSNAQKWIEYRMGGRELPDRTRCMGARPPGAHTSGGAARTYRATGQHRAGVGACIHPPPPARHRRPLRQYGDRERAACPLPGAETGERRIPPRTGSTRGPVPSSRSRMHSRRTRRGDTRPRRTWARRFKERPEYRGLLRARDRIAGLMKVLLLKRLESSVAAFRSTLNSLIQSNRNFREALGTGYVPVGATATRLLAGQGFDPDDLLEILQQEEALGTTRGAAYPTEHFDTDKWITDLDADYEVLGGLADRVRDIAPDDDDKLRALRAFLARPEVRSGKVLIFSEAETTINYLYEQLNPGGNDPEIARLSGGNRANAENIISRFSPRSNPPAARPMPDLEIRVLLATDVVSEGQNLQDCARVLNYDLHWNPVRLIQRFGRVDRIGTEHDVIDLHSMWPDTDVDAGLELTDRLNQRIQSFHDLIGLDNRLLSETERLNADAMYRIYGEQAAAGGRRRTRRGRSAPARRGPPTAHPRGQPGVVADSHGPAGWNPVSAADRAAEAAGCRQQRARPGRDAHRGRTATPSCRRRTWCRRSRRPLDDPVAGETLVLLAAGDVHGCYAVGDSLEPRAITARSTGGLSRVRTGDARTAAPGGHQRARHGGVRSVPARVRATARSGAAPARHEGPPLRLAPPRRRRARGHGGRRRGASHRRPPPDIRRRPFRAGRERTGGMFETSDSKAECYGIASRPCVSATASTRRMARTEARRWIPRSSASSAPTAWLNRAGQCRSVGQSRLDR